MFFNYIIYIFIGQNDTAIQPMTSGPVTADHVASIIGVPFLQSIIYIYIHWLKRHDHPANDIRPSDIHHWSAVFTIYYIYIYIHWPKRHDHSANDTRPSDIRHWSAVFTIYYIYIYIFIGQNDTSVLLATHISGLPCFFNYNINILMAQTTRF